MSDAEDDADVDGSARPSWLSWTNLAAGIQVAAAVGGLGYWLVITSTKTEVTATALVAMTARLDRIAEKLEGLPVLMEVVQRLEKNKADRDGQIGGIDGRLRTVEQQTGVNTAQIGDLVTASKQKLR